MSDRNVAGSDFRLSRVGLVMALSVVSASCKVGYGPAPNTGHRRAVECLEDLCVDGHGRNREAGWWTDPRTGEPLQRNVPEMLMLAVSELAEVPPFPLHMSEPDDKLPHRLMAEVEIADAIIRMFDTLGSRMGEGADILYCGAHVLDLPDLRSLAMDPQRLDVQLMAVVRHISYGMEGYRKRKTFTFNSGHTVPVLTLALTHAVLSLFALGNTYGFDLPGAIAEKMEFNATREDHKREARLAPGGKAF